MAEDQNIQVEETNEDVTLVYNGPDASFQVVGENRESGDGRVKDGDEVTFPAEVAKGVLLGSSWSMADGSSKYEFMGVEDEYLDDRADLIDPNATSEPAGLTADSEHSDVPYEELYREDTEKALLEGGDTSVVSPVHERLEEIRAQEDAASEGEGDTGDEESREDVDE